MEVPVIKPDGKVSKGEAVHDFCHQCYTDSQLVPAVGFCQDCLQQLCQKCYDGHTISSSTRTHRLHLLSSAAAAPASPASSNSSNKGTMTCPKHPQKVVEVYCITHDSAVCAMCIYKHHKSCDTEDLTAVPDDFYQSNDYSGLNEILRNYNTTIDLIYSNADKNITDTEQSNDDALKELNRVMNTIIDHFKQIQKDLITAGQQDKDTDINSLKDIKAECLAMKSKITQQQTELQRHEHNNVDLYVTSSHALTLVEKLQVKIENLSLRNQSVGYVFKPDAFIQTITKTSCLGTITSTDIPPPIPRRQSTLLRQEIPQIPRKSKPASRNVSTTKISVKLASAKVTRMADIHVKNSKDWPNSVTGMTLLSPSKLLVADYRNESVRCINPITNTVESYLKLSGDPYDITVLPDDQAAVTLPTQNKIQILSTAGPLARINTIDVKGHCRGIASTKDKLIVSYSEFFYTYDDNDGDRLEILDFHGHVLYTIQYDTYGVPMFSRPWYIAVSGEEGREVIYVSDCGTDAVTKLTMTGQVLLTYTDQDLMFPGKLIVTDDEHVLVCSKGTGQVHLVSPRGEKMKTILSKADVLICPTALCASTEQNMIYISDENQGSLNVYQFE